MADDDRCKDFKHVTKGLKYRKISFQIMEAELCNCVKEHARKSRKESKSLTMTQANFFLKDSQPDEATNFVPVFV